MRGIPKRFGTATDVAVCVDQAMAGDVQKNEMTARLRAMLNTSDVYVRDKVLASVEDADGEEPDYRVMETEATEGGTEIVQYKLSPNPASTPAMLGMDDETVRQYISKLEGI